MRRQLSILQAIGDFIFGHKYYTFAVRRVGTEEPILTGEIFYSKREAKRRLAKIQDNRTFVLLDMVSFRSRKKDLEALVLDCPHIGL